MKCVVAGPNVKILGKAIHTLAKIGDELYLESLEAGLAVRTVNASRSAFAGFTFPPNFFLEYDDRGTSGGGEDNGDAETSFKGKLAVRSVLFVFKRLADMDKSVERCIVSADSTDSRVVFTFHCKYGIVKTHKLAYIESETLVVNHDKSRVPNRITSPPSVFIDAISCFHNAVEEIVFEPFFDKLVVRNHCDDALLGGGGGRGGTGNSAVDPAKFTSVKFSLSPGEFDVYVVKPDDREENAEDSNGDATENPGVAVNKRTIRFCLKELRALLSFAETYSSSMGVFFGDAGEPIVYSLDSDPGYEADFVFATSPPDDDDGDEDDQRENRTTAAAAAPPPPPKSVPRSRPNRSSPVKRAILTQRSSQRPTNSSRLDESNLNESLQQHHQQQQHHHPADDAPSSADRKAHDISPSSMGHSNSAASGDGRLSTTFNQSAAAEAGRKKTLKKLLGDDDDDDDSDEENENRLTRKFETKNSKQSKNATAAGEVIGSNPAPSRRTKPALLFPESEEHSNDAPTSSNGAPTSSNDALAFLKDAASNDAPASRRTKPALLPESEEDDVATTPPSTPPSKKFKSIFGCAESQSQNSLRTVTSRTQGGAASATQRQVLAEDSEGED